MKPIGLTVLPYNEPNLFEALRNRHYDAAEVAGQPRARYLAGYLDKIATRSIVIEDPYTDADYLDDFASYYVRCHTEYSSRCKRLHFFRSDLSEGWFESALTKEGLDQLQSSYCGFIVARPLPDAIIGRTVLSTYDADNGRRKYPATLDYEVHLCGLDLRVGKSLAFQEQDTILAACATVALWSCFQKTAQLFHTPIPSPSAITRAATQYAHRGRPIPSHGLFVPEICNAIRHIGLEPELFESGPKLPLASLLYGYLHAGLPVILGVDVAGQGGHAIALAGYSIQKERVQREEQGTSVPMRGQRIDAFHGHDDQAGPYSRLAIQISRETEGFHLQSEGWRDESGNGLVPLRPTVIIVPVYHKIRITFLDVQTWLSKVHRLFAVWLRHVQLEWDVRLCMASQYKADLQKDAWIPADLRNRGMRQDLPRFLWRATLWADGQAAADLLFDATGLARTLPLVSVEWLGVHVADKIEELLTSESFRETADALLTPRLNRFLKESLAQRHGGAPATGLDR